ncbi:Hsp70 family protein [Rhodococcus koreensis]
MTATAWGQDWVLAIDFGTTATSAATRVDGQVLALTLPDGAGWMPSSVYADDTGGLLVGQAADNNALYALDRYEPTPKRRVGRPVVPLGDDEFPPAQLIGAVLEKVLGEAIYQHDGRPPTRLVLTHPVGWESPRTQVLIDALGHAAAADPRLDGVPEPVFVSEPVAAAQWYARNDHPQPGQCFGVYDLGGGTFDAAVLQQTDTGFEVLDKGGLDPLGGFDFDNLLFAYLGTTHIAAIDPQRWAELSTPNPTDHRACADRRNMQTRVRLVKEQLSNNPVRECRLPGLPHPTMVTVDEYENLIRDRVEHTVTELEATIARAGLTPEQLTAIYRIGGAARTPLVGRALDRLHRPVRTFDHPKLVVAQGATVTTQTEQRRLDPVAERSKRLFDQATAAGQSGDHTAAVADYQQIITLAHRDWAPRAAYTLGQHHQSQHSFDAARTDYQYVLDCGHPHWSPLAAQALQQLPVEDPIGAESQQLWNTAHDRQRQGDPAGADAGYRRIIALGHPYWVQQAAQALQQLHQPGPKKPVNAAAIVALVFGVAGLCGTGIAATVVGHLSLNQIKHTGDRGKWMAIAGTILGYGWLLFSIILILAGTTAILAMLGFGAICTVVAVAFLRRPRLGQAEGHTPSPPGI